MPILSLQLQKRIVLCREAEGLNLLQYSDCAVVVLCVCCKPTNNCWDWAFSNSELDDWLPAFSCRGSQNVTHCRKEICSTCLFKESIPAIPFVKSKPPRPSRSLSFLRTAYVPLSLPRNSKHPSLPAWGSWEPQHAPPVLHYRGIMPKPSL